MYGVLGESIQRDLFDEGIGGVIVNMIHNGHVPGAVATAGEALRPLLPAPTNG